MITAYTHFFDNKNEAALKVKSGATVSFKTMDCFSNQIKTEKDLLTNINLDSVNPASGPLFIEGAEDGDVLEVEIKSIELDSSGAVTIIPGWGPLAQIVEIKTKIIKIRDEKASFNDLTFDIKPMIGVIGVAPKGEKISTGLVGAHGGNLDCKLIKSASKVYFPVKNTGALLQIGDLHGAMGDGEICGAGLEISGKVTVKVNLIKNFPQLEWPALETKDKWYVMASAQEFEKALEIVTLQMQKLISKAYNWDASDSYLYLSLQGDLEVNQACQPSPMPIILRLGIPKQNDLPLIF